MNRLSTKLSQKLIRKYQKELKLKEWDIDCEFNSKTKTSLYTNIKKREALIVINNSKLVTQRALIRVIKYQMTKLKRKIIYKK